MKNTILSDEIGQPPWSFMGNHVKPIVVDGSFDVHDMDDIVKTEEWLVENKIKY